MVSSKGRTWLYVGITSFKGKISLTFLLLLFSATCFASGGSCPSNLPVGTPSGGCYYVSAQSGASDSNSGTSESSPWLHAPGMPNCTGLCASTPPSKFTTWSAGIIFRGGDTWHEGNSSLSPYTGGAYAIEWIGNSSACAYESAQTGCLYIGVDTTWYNSSVCGSSWCRPKLDEDNALSTSPVSSCSYHTAALPSPLPSATNNMFYDRDWVYFDSFEFRGFCSANMAGYAAGGNDNVLNVPNNGGAFGSAEIMFNNIYIHGWTITTGTSTGNSSPCILLGGSTTDNADITGLVIDGSDAVAGGCMAGYDPSFYHFKDSILRYTTNLSGVSCHDIHDNIFEYFPTGTYQLSAGLGSWGNHPNMFECNSDWAGSTPNVVYNNIFRHDNPNVAGVGEQHFQVVPPTSTPEYYFNNLMYDLIGGEYFLLCEAPHGQCSNTGAAGQWMFNNTLVDAIQPCSIGPSGYVGGQYLTLSNEHLINTPFDNVGGTNCVGYSSATNIVMSDATATTQGYTTGSTGYSGATNTCANDKNKPCSPTASSNGTVGAGTNFQSYCTKLASYTSETAIGTDAANACKYGTTDGCTYNTSTHTMVCPAQSAIARSGSGAWDVGAYAFGSALSPPTGLTASVQ